MGKFILCSGKRAKEPYYVNVTDTVLYTIEELCYFLYQNIYLVADDFFDDALIQWIREQTGKFELAQKLQGLNANGNSLKDKVICVLCSADYYSEREMKELLAIMNKMEGLPLIKRRKIRADIFVKYGRYLHAAEEYEAILKSKDASILTTKEYGNLLHNYAIVLLNLGALVEAEEKLKEAYQANQDMETLKSYVFVMKMRNSSSLEEEKSEKQISDELYLQVDEVIKEASSMESKNLFHGYYRKLEGEKDKSELLKFFQEVDILLEQWIQEYRNKVS